VEGAREWRGTADVRKGDEEHNKREGVAVGGQYDEAVAQYSKV
jgi:hypothetical protein